MIKYPVAWLGLCSTERRLQIAANHSYGLKQGLFSRYQGCYLRQKCKMWPIRPYIATIENWAELHREH